MFAERKQGKDVFEKYKVIKNMSSYNYWYNYFQISKADFLLH